jgi:hypothetical protein
MSENMPEEDKLGEEFRNLGKNLFGVLQAAWDHPERKRMQAEIENGLREFSNSLQREADSFSRSTTGEKIKSDIGEIGKRINSGETQSRIYEDIISALKTANSELSKVIEKIDQDKSQSSPPASDEPEKPG